MAEKPEEPKKPKKELKSVERQPPEKLTQLAKDIMQNLVFTDRHIRENSLDMIPSIFMVIALGGFADETKEYKEDIGMLYEYYSQAGPMSVNGYPMFFSVHVLGKEDAKIVWEKFEKMRKAIDEA